MRRAIICRHYLGGASSKSKDNIKLITQARHIGGGPFADLRKTALKPKNCAKVCAEMGIQTAFAQMLAARRNSAHCLGRAAARRPAPRRKMYGKKGPKSRLICRRTGVVRVFPLKSMARKYAKGYIFFVFFHILTRQLTVYGV